MNQMLNQIMGQQAQDNPILKAWKIVQSAQDPQKALMDALLKGNNSDEVMNILKQNNFNAEKAFYDYAKLKGEDPNQLIQQLQSMGLK